jgi:hypothetical protein
MLFFQATPSTYRAGGRNRNGQMDNHQTDHLPVATVSLLT